MILKSLEEILALVSPAVKLGRQNFQEFPRSKFIWHIDIVKLFLGYNPFSNLQSHLKALTLGNCNSTGLCRLDSGSLLKPLGIYYSQYIVIFYYLLLLLTETTALTTADSTLRPLSPTGTSSTDLA